MDGVVAQATQDVVGSRRRVDRVVSTGRAAGRDPRNEGESGRYAHRAFITEDVVHPTVGANDVRPAVADDEVHSGATDDLIISRPTLQAIDTLTALDAEPPAGLVTANHDQVVARSALHGVYGGRAATIEIEAVLARSAIEHELRGDALTHIHSGIHHTSAGRVV